MVTLYSSWLSPLLMENPRYKLDKPPKWNIGPSLSKLMNGFSGSRRAHNPDILRALLLLIFPYLLSRFSLLHAQYQTHAQREIIITSYHNFSQATEKVETMWESTFFQLLSYTQHFLLHNMTQSKE